VAFTEIHVVHSGSDHSAASRARKLKRDFHLLELELRDRPDHPFVLFNLGMTHADAEQYQEAIEFLTHCIEVSGPEESHVRKAYALLVSSLSKADRPDAAWTTCQKGLELFSTDKELLFRQAMLQHEFGRLDEAAHSYQTLIDSRPERYFQSIDLGIGGAKARHNLALVHEDRGDILAAAREWHRILMDHPNYHEAKSAIARLSASEISLA
jgi:tetratricopeptide (TPR) repeat protein